MTGPSADTVLLHLPHVLTESQLARFREALLPSNARWIDGRVTAGHQGAAVKSNQQLDESSPLARELGEIVLAAFERNALFVSAVLPNRVYPPMFNRYVQGMGFGNHVDGSIRRLPSRNNLRTDLS